MTFLYQTGHRVCHWVVAVTFLLIVGCGRGEGTRLPRSPPGPSSVVSKSKAPAQQSAFYADSFSKRPTVPEMTRLGRSLFFDPSLSASGQLACATCHDPKFAYGPPPKGVLIRTGGKSAVLESVRAIPSLKYMQNVPPFGEHHYDEAVDESVDQGPTGGHMWDGRADTLHDQARLPLFSTSEMANSSSAQIVDKVRRGAHAQCVKSTFGDDVFDSNETAFKAVLMALEVFQQSPREFYPYDSKYDSWLRGKTQLSAAETRGLQWFNDPHGGNCANCHPSQIRNGSFPQFTDYGLIALGVPRNATLAANKEATYFDLGLCGPQRTDLSSKAEYCGLFKAPSLRNVTLRHTFFHNGVFHDLRQVVDFYVERDSHPAKFYPESRDGHVNKFDDLPSRYQANVNTESPFGEESAGRGPLPKKKLDDVLAFLSALADGYQDPNNPTTPPLDPAATQSLSNGC
jgi:cytochrome c peroxidase